MKFSELWLREWVNPAIDSEALSDQITMAGLEVDGVEPVAGSFNGVVVGEVVECGQHPNADKLRVTKVNVGGERLLDIVCGAPNCRQGLKVAVATIGAVLPGDFKIKAAKLRGEPSEGMLCSFSELGISDDHSGIIELPADAPIGTDIREYLKLDDNTIEISVTPNRADCLGIIGVARDVAVLNKAPLNAPEITPVAATIDDVLPIQVDAPQACPRYLGRVVKGINVKAPTPLWMKEKLRRCGIRSIDAVVDVTNYVLLELGQPMHAFDMDTLESCQIIVRRAKDGEKITTLDSKEFTLTPQNLVICDGEKPVALAGVMGGLNSEIKPETTQLLFESAKFARDNIRKTARGLGQNTDASAHYEKGISEYTTELGMARALHLIQELGCGEVTATEFDCSAGAPRKGKHFTARISAINAILGITVPTEEILAILKKLSFEVTMEADGDTMQVVAPRYREDIEIGEPDLAEEVIREYGYDHITPTFLKAAQVTTGGLTADQHRRDKLKSAMCAQGFYEAMTLAFYADADLDALHIAPDAPERNVIRIVNPISSNLTIMRSLLAPSLLNVAVTNLKKGNAAGRLFELSNIYVPKQLPLTELPEERLHLGFVAFGEHEDFFAVKGALEDLAASFGVTFEVERAEDVPYLHPGIAAYILCNGVRVGSFGKLANDVQAGLDLPRDSRANQKIFLGEIDYETLVAQLPAGLRYHPLPEFDTVARDLALVADEETPCGTIIAEMKRACKQLADVELFDIYRSEAIGAGKKSMAFTLHFAPENKALEAADVDRFVKKILGNLKFKLGIEIR